MEVTLPPQIENLIQKKIASGLYHSVGELISNAIYALDFQERVRAMKIEDLRKELEPAIQELDEGKGTPFDMNEIIQSAKKERMLGKMEN